MIVGNLAWQGRKGKANGRRKSLRTSVFVSYSPELNSIEEAFSKIKHFLCRVGARTEEALEEAIGEALDAVGTRDVEGFFVHCGYPGLAQ